jgi:hypothetical protein
MEGVLFVLSMIGVLFLRLYAEKTAASLNEAANRLAAETKAHAEEKRKSVTVFGTAPEKAVETKAVERLDVEAPDDSFLSGDQARALIAVQLMQSGMDPSKEASWHAAAEDVVDLQMGDLDYEIEPQSEEIRMEDDESEYQASLEAQASEEAEAARFELERRDETIRMD